jgi:MinD-like ATPase involved in chromosome partitioning or flagellar assembly
MSNGGRIISVGGAKGGAGKSVIAANLAVALAQEGRRVVLADLDLGAASQHLLLGVQNSRPGVRALLEGTAADVQEALTPTDVPNLSLLAGGGAVTSAAELSPAAKARLLRKLLWLDAVVVLDVGAGVGYGALDLFLLGAQKVVVTTTQVTAIHDACSFLKGAVLRTIETELREAGLPSGEPGKISTLVERLHEERPELADPVEALLARFGAFLVGNLVDEPAEARVLPSVATMMRESFGVDVPLLGWVPAAATVSGSASDGRPFALDRSTEEARAIREIAGGLMAHDIAGELDLEVEISIEEEPATPLVALATPPRTKTPSRRATLIRGMSRHNPTDATATASRRRPLTLPGMTPFPR